MRVSIAIIVKAVAADPSDAAAEYQRAQQASLADVDDIGFQFVEVRVDFERRKARTSVDDTAPDFMHRRGNGQRRQLLAVTEGVGFDVRHTIPQGDAGNIGAVVEGGLTDVAVHADGV